MPLTLTASVGRSGVNNADDVRAVQTLLVVANRLVGVPAFAPVVDGVSGANTEKAIEDFQRDRMRASVVDGRVDPGGATLTALNQVASRPIITVLQPGDTTRLHPYTIALIANPAIESPTGSGTFIVDPVMTNPAAFDRAAAYNFDVLFGRLPNQVEQLLADPAIGPRIRVVKIFHTGLPVVDANALVSHYAGGITEARRDRFVAFLANYGIMADVAYALTASTTHTRASAWFSTENTTRGGVPFNLDGTAFTHHFYPIIPGTVAQHILTNSLTGLHEFGHAASSFTDGQILDQYVDSSTGVNNKNGRPIPAGFATLDGTAFASDPLRDGLGYPPSWSSYHPALTNPAVPSLMDNYWAAPGGIPEVCVFDTITVRYLRDRLIAKLSRP